MEETPFRQGRIRRVFDGLFDRLFCRREAPLENEVPAESTVIKTTPIEEAILAAGYKFAEAIPFEMLNGAMSRYTTDRRCGLVRDFILIPTTERDPENHSKLNGLFYTFYIQK